MFNIKFTQTGNICLLASYGIIVEFLSEGKYSLSKVLSTYIKINRLKIPDEIKINTTKFNRIAERENLISNHYHDYCSSLGDMRGTEYVKLIHEKNSLNSNHLATILRINAQKRLLTHDEISMLENDLKDGNIALIVTDFGQPGAYHASVVAYNNKTINFIIRDPNIKKESEVQTLKSLSISEYIIFKPNK